MSKQILRRPGSFQRSKSRFDGIALGFVGGVGLDTERVESAETGGWSVESVGCRVDYRAEKRNRSRPLLLC